MSCNKIKIFLILLIIICLCCSNVFIKEHNKIIYGEQLYYDYRTDTYINYCWRCDADINSNYCRRCYLCGWYICINCGACYGPCDRCPSWTPPKKQTTSQYNYNSQEKEEKDYSFLLIVALLGVGAFLYYKYRQKQ